MKADRDVRFLCWDNYLTAGTDEVSMGMVKRVVETAHRGVLPGSGSCELEPE